MKVLKTLITINLSLLSLLSTNQSYASRIRASSEALNVVNNLGAKNCDIRNQGFHCFISIASRPVDVIIPRDYQPSGECIVHFHGLRMRDVEDATPKSTIEYFNFETGLNREAPTALMIAPVGDFGQYNYTLNRDYSSLTQLNSLLTSIESLAKQNCQKIELSGHSAAYRVLTPLLQELNSAKTGPRAQSVRAIFVFDALYSSNVSPFTTWIDSDPGHYLYNVSLTGSDTRSNSLLIGPSPRYSNFLSAIDDHWDLVRDQYFSQFLQQSRKYF